MVDAALGMAQTLSRLGRNGKLRYMDQIARALGNVDPVRRRAQTDITVDEMEMTVGEFYRRDGHEVALGDLTLDADLQDIFDASRRRKNTKPAQQFLHEHRKTVVDKVTYWTGAQRPLIKQLIESIEKRLGELNLFADAKREAEHLIQISVYATALATNYVHRGKFVQP